MTQGSTINSSLLVIANLTGNAVRGSRFGGAFCKQYLNTYFFTMFHQANSLHKYGLVRMLAWVPEDDKSSFLPRTVASGDRQAIELDLATNIEEVAAGNWYTSADLRRQRHFDMEVESQQRIKERSSPGEIPVPSGRMNPPPIPHPLSFAPDHASLAAMREIPHNVRWIDELSDLETRLARDEIKEWGDQRGKSGSLISGDEDRDRRRLQKIRNLWQTQHNTLKKCIALAAEQRVQDGQSRASAASGTGEEDMATAKLVDKLAKLPRDASRSLEKMVDDQRAFDHEPPILAWDRRTKEPLLAQDDEFFPARSLSLLDFRPRTSLPLLLDTTEKRTCFKFVVFTLSQRPRDSVRNALAGLIEAGIDEFIARVPGLNPLKVGNGNLDEIRVRTLPPEVIVEIALAWETWPFRPAMTDIMFRQGNISGEASMDI